METESYLNKKGWEFKNARNNFCVHVCPLCGDEKWHFYINSSNGLWNCKKCFSKGNLYQLKKQLGDSNEKVKSLSQLIGKKESVKPLGVSTYLKLHTALLDNTTAMNYLKEERMLTEKAIKHFKLGLSKDGDMCWLTIPQFNQDRLINIKYRSLPPAEKRFKRESGRPTILFNQDCLNGSYTEVFITEGEMDAMSLWQVGFPNVVGTTAGAGSFPPEWHERLEKMDRIYICFDNDIQGQKGAFDVANKLGLERCVNVVIPQNDLNEYFLTYTKEDFIEHTIKSKKFEIPSISSIKDTIKDLEEELFFKPQKKGIKSGWENVDRRIGSFEPGDLIVVSAIPKTGKTTFALNIAYHNAKEEIPCLFYCLEMRPERLLMKIISIALNREITEYDKQTIDEAREKIAYLPLYFGYAYKRIDLNSVLETIRNAVKRYDIKFVVFDNLHFLVRSIKYVTQEVGLVTQSFKLLAEELEIPIMLIAQPRKKNPDEMITMQDLKDSASIGADSDQIITLHRKRIKSSDRDGMLREELEITLEPETLIRVEASRYHPGGDTMLFFDGARSTFKKL